LATFEDQNPRANWGKKIVFALLEIARRKKTPITGGSKTDWSGF